VSRAAVSRSRASSEPDVFLQEPRKGQRVGPFRSQPVVLIGAGEESRTPDLRITNALLYQLSYTGEKAHCTARGTAHGMVTREGV
jgi:hypothetical protein